MAAAPSTSATVPSLSPHDVRRSVLAGRLVVLVDRSGSGAGWSVERALAPRPEVARVAATGVLHTGAPRLFGNHLLSQDAGLGRLIPLPALTQGIRRLLDDLLTTGLPAAAAGGLVVELALAPDTPVRLARAVYPDATIAVIGERSDADADVVDLWLQADRARDDPATAAGTLVDRAATASVRWADPSSPVGRGARPGPELLLVFGVPRSGTTWLEELLLAHPATGGVAASETWMFTGVQGFWENLEGAGGLACVTDRVGLATALRRFCDELFLHRLSEQPGATHFVEKTPGNAWLLPWIGAVYPDAWYVHLVRDGRDVSRSVAEMVHGTDDVRVAAEQWAATLREVRSRRWSLARYREVRYEELLADPVAGASRLLAWAGLDVDPAAAQAISAAAGVRVSRHGTTGPVGVGKWTTMPVADQRAVVAAAGDELVAHGYASVDDVTAARRALRRPGGVAAELRRRLALTARRRARGRSR